MGAVLIVCLLPALAWFLGWAIGNGLVVLVRDRHHPEVLDRLQKRKDAVRRVSMIFGATGAAAFVALALVLGAGSPREVGVGEATEQGVVAAIVLMVILGGVCLFVLVASAIHAEASARIRREQRVIRDGGPLVTP